MEATFLRALPASSTCTSLWSSTSTGEKVATELTLPNLAGSNKNPVFSLECRSLVGLVAHDVTACGCELHPHSCFCQRVQAPISMDNLCVRWRRDNEQFVLLSTSTALCDDHGTLACVVRHCAETTAVHVSKDGAPQTFFAALTEASQSFTVWSSTLLSRFYLDFLAFTVVFEVQREDQWF